MAFALFSFRRWLGLAVPTPPRSPRPRNAQHGRWLSCALEELEPRVMMADGSYLVPGQLGQATAAQVQLLSRSAGSRHELGVFRVDDASGRVGSLMPRDAGYAAAALDPLRRHVVVGPSQKPGTGLALDLPAGGYYGLYLVRNGTSDRLLARNPRNRSGRGPVAFFSFRKANPDKALHFRTLSGGRIGIEDARPGGKKDFKDLVCRLGFGPPRGGVVPPTPTPSRLTLREGDGLLVQGSLPLPAGQGPRTLTIELAPSFDRSDAAALEDVFQVYLVDPADTGRTLLDSRGQGTPLFSLAGDQADYRAGLVRYDGSRVEVDLGAVTGGGTLLFRLLSSDDDTGTTVEVGPLSVQANVSTLAAPMFPLRDERAPTGAALDLPSLSPSATLQLLVENPRFDTATGRYTVSLRVRNNGPASGRRVAAVFADLPAGVTLLDPSGTDAGGDPYVSFRDAIPAGGLATGQTSRPVEVVFSDLGQVRFRLAAQLLAGGPNAVPVLDPLGPLTVLPGGRLEIPIVANDPDGDPVTLSLRGDALPTGMLQANGRLVFTPGPGEVGVYTFTVLASDGAAEATRDVTLTVAADPITTTRLSGMVQDAAGTPLSGILVELGAVQTTTAADGAFTLEFGGALPDAPVRIRGEQFAGAVSYPLVGIHPSVLLGREPFASTNNVIGRPIFLTPLDTANGVTVIPAANTTVTTSAISGASLFVPAGSTTFAGQLSITAVSRDRTPAALPAELVPDLVVTIGPAETTFSTPVQLTLPNRAGWAAGVLFDLWSLDPTTGRFLDVGDGRIGTDGSLVQTIAGGIGTTGLHFFVPRPATPLDLTHNAFNLNSGGNEQAQTLAFTSEVELHSGAVLETHGLVTYQSVGQPRGLTLRYDSLRADPRPIVHFGFPAVDPAALAGLDTDQLRLVAQLTFRRGNFEYQVPGFANAPQFGLTGNEHFWTLPTTPGEVEAALQADLRSLPSGLYDYELTLGLRRFDGNGQQLVGSATRQGGQILHVNTIGSTLGNGWGLSGVAQIVENADGSVLLLDGDGSELHFGAPFAAGQPYVSPAGEFSSLVKLGDGTFRRTTREQIVLGYDATGRLTSVRDSNGNTTTYGYDGQGRLITVTDPVALQTTLTYGVGIVDIRDPANRLTRLELNAAGNLVRITDPDDSQRTFGYDGGHHLISEIDKRGFLEQTEYGFHGRALRGVRGDGSVVLVDPMQTHGLFAPERTTVPFTAPSGNLDLLALQADPRGGVILSQLDSSGQVVARSDVFGSRVEVIQRNTRNLPTLIRVDNNAYAISYDTRGNPIGLFDQFSGVGAAPPIFPETGDTVHGPWYPGDHNGDGRADLAFFSGASEQFLLFLSNGDGTFRPGETLPLRAFFGNEADLNGDRLPDYYDIDHGVFPPALETSLSRSYTRTSTPLVDQAQLRPGEFFQFGVIAPTDADGDGDLDLLLSATSNEREGVVVAHNSGTGTFQRVDLDSLRSFPATGTVFGDYFSADLDGDGDDDLVGNLDSGGLVTRINDGIGGYRVGPTITSPDPFEVTGVRDLNRDDRADLLLKVFPQGGATFLAVAINRGDSFDTPSAVAPDLGTGLIHAVGDLNGDTRLDLFIGGIGFSNQATVLFGDVFGRFSSGFQFTMGQPGPQGVALEDIDGDGDLDFLSRGSALLGPGVAVQLNDGTGRPSAGVPEQRRTEYDPFFNQPTRETDEIGRQTFYAIDPVNGNRLSATRVVGAAGGADDVVTEYTYTPLGQLDTETNPLGVVTDHDYDLFGRLIRITYALGTPDQAVRQYEYDAAGNQTAIIDENDNRTDQVIDLMNRLRQVIQPDPDGAGPLLPPVTLYAYDEAGNRTTTTDPHGNVTTEEYDPRNHVISRTDPDPDGTGPLSAPVTRFGYDAAGHRNSAIDPLLRETRSVYDTRNRLRQTIDAEGGITEYGYDNNDNRTLVIDPAGNRTTFEYDGRGRLLFEMDPRGESITFVYDEVDQLEVKTDRNGRRIEYTYDDLGRLLTETWVVPGQSPANVIQYTYFADGNRETVRDNFSALAYTYDARDRILTVDNNGTPNVPRVVLTYTYDDVGNVLSVTDAITGQPAGVNAYAYDALNRTTQVTQSGTAVSPKRVEFDYNLLGQYTLIERFAALAGGAPIVSSAYAYDHLDRLISLTHSNATAAVAAYTLSHDVAGRITEIVDPDGTRTFAYDDTDQLTSATHSNANFPDEGFAYDANGSRTGAGIVLDPGNRLRSDGTFGYDYDDEGNLIRRTEIATGLVRDFEWDHRNRLTRVTDCNVGGTATQVVRYAYDALNRRIVQAEDTTPQDAVDAVFGHYVYDRGNVLLEFVDVDGSGPNAPVLAMRYLHGPSVDQVLVQENYLEADASLRVLWLLPDHLGSTRDLVDSTGTVRNHIVYGAFGRVISQSNPTVQTRYLFTGREFDAATGLYYYRARYYDPATGRFLSEDPRRFEAGDRNLSRYVNNNPISLVDPTGLYATRFETFGGSTTKEFARSELQLGDHFAFEANGYEIDVTEYSDELRINPRQGSDVRFPIASDSVRFGLEVVTNGTRATEQLTLVDILLSFITPIFLITSVQGTRTFILTEYDASGNKTRTSAPVRAPFHGQEDKDKYGGVEWLFLAGLGLLTLGQVHQRRRSRRRRQRTRAETEPTGCENEPR